jgi:hypothetical protein
MGKYIAAIAVLMLGLTSIDPSGRAVQGRDHASGARRWCSPPGSAMAKSRLPVWRRTPEVESTRHFGANPIRTLPEEGLWGATLVNIAD